MQKMIKQKILCVLLAIILLLSISIASFATNNNIENNIQDNNIVNTNDIMNTNDINELTDQKNEAQEKIEDINSKIEYVQTEISNSVLEIQELDDKIRKYEQENAELIQRLESLETSITEQLEITTAEYNKKYELLKERLVTIYEEGNIAYLEVLLSAKSLSEFLGIYYAMVEIAEYDNALIDEVDEKRQLIENSKQKLENETSEVKILKVQAERSEVILKNTKT